MSIDLSPERVCYVHCNFCTTILAVSVPYASLFSLVTVRCGHCTNLLSLNIGVSLHQTSPPPFHPDSQASSSSKNTNNVSENIDREHRRKDNEFHRPTIDSSKEIQRIKACNPKISHREAFSTAAKNWAHFPHIHFGLKLDGNKKGKQLDQTVAHTMMPITKECVSTHNDGS